MYKSVPYRCPKCYSLKERYYGKLRLPPEKRRDGSWAEQPIPVCETCSTQCVAV